MPTNRQESNLPIIYSSYATSEKKKFHGPLLRSGMSSIVLDYLDLFRYLITDTDISGTEG